MKMHWGTVCVGTRAALLALVFIALGACSSPTETANKYYQKGMALMEQGDLVKARIELKNALQIRPRLTKATFALAQIAEQQGDWAGLFSLLNTVLDQQPQHLQAQIKLGRMLLSTDQLAKAKMASDAALALDANNPEVLGLRAGLLYKQGDTLAAVAHAQAALAIEPSNIDALVVLATERVAANDAEKAIEYLDRSLRGSGRSMALQLIKAPALAFLEREDSFEPVFHRLIALYPQDRALRHVLARFYLAHNRTDDAEAEYRAIAAESPQDIQAGLDVVRFMGENKTAADAVEYLQGLVVIAGNNNELSFVLADMQRAQGDSRAAEAVLRAIMARSGDGFDGSKAKGLLAGVLLSKGDQAAAQVLINEVLAEDSRNEEGLLLKASLEIDAHQFDGAILDLRTILHDSPRSARALLLLAKAHELAGALELAQESYLSAYEAGKPAPQFAGAYVEFLLQRTQFVRAEIIALQMLQVKSQHVPALKLLAQARIGQGDWSGAQAVADELGQLAGQEAAAEQIRGGIFVARNDYPAAITAFRLAYAAAPLDMPAIESLTRTLVLADRTPEAIEFLHSRLKESPQNAAVYLLLGDVQATNEDSAAAALALKQFIILQPLDAGGYANLARVNVGAGRFSEAQQVLDQGLARIPENFQLLLAKASTVESSGHFSEAINAYEGLLKAYPASDVVIDNLARLLSEHSTDREGLVRAYELAQRFRLSHVARFKGTLGWASYRVGKVEEGVALLKEAIRQAPEQPVFHYRLAMCYLALNNQAQARKALETALELSQGVGFPEAAAALRMLLTH